MKTKTKAIKMLAAASLIALASCSGGSDNAETGVIDVAGAIANPQTLTTDILGKKITYLPLETTDSSLVDGHYSLVVTDNYLVTVPTSSRGGSVLCFDLATGRHVGTLGHPGQDPDAYTSKMPFTNAAGNTFYFNHNDSYPVQYAPDGACLGHPEITAPLTGPLNTTVLADGTFVGVKTLPTDNGFGVDIFKARPGLKTDTVCAIAPTDSVIDPMADGFGSLGGEVTSINVFSYFAKNMSGSFIQINTTRRTVTVAMIQELYSCGDKLHYAPMFVDTIYTLTPDGISPLYTLDMGPDVFTVAKSVNQPVGDNELWGRVVADTPDCIIYAVRRGRVSDDPETSWICRYDKRTATTVATRLADGFADPAGNLPPVLPLVATPGGKIIATYDYDTLAEWFDSNPDAERPDWFESLAEDANPVAVIIE